MKPTLWQALQVATFAIACTALYLSIRPAAQPRRIELRQGEASTTIEPGHISITHANGSSVEIWGHNSIRLRASNGDVAVHLSAGLNNCGQIALQTGTGDMQILGDCRPPGD